MVIYISHLRRSDFENELYKPLRNSSIAKNHQLVLPHEKNDEPFDTKALFKSGQCNLVIAEVSHPSTGQGIELGWANIFNIPIICIYKKGSDVAGSLKMICDTFIEYEDSEDMIKQVENVINIEMPHRMSLRTKNR